LLRYAPTADLVRRGETLTVTRDGSPLAELRPLPRQAAAAVLETWRNLPPSIRCGSAPTSTRSWTLTRETDQRSTFEAWKYSSRNTHSTIVATRPGRVVACAENEYTLGALRGAGVELRPFEASEIVRWGGGPHCITLPLERDR
jgi:antitoxin (DNA-binding transcriptional repressor) of toxin-antitoxin stability system